MGFWGERFWSGGPLFSDWVFVVRASSDPRDLTIRCSQPLAGVQSHFSMINTRSFRAQFADASGG
jgi:hypothetical protein